MGFLRFWYDFIVGDDRTMAVGVIVTFGLAAVLVHADIPAWWMVPVAVLLLLAGSLWRATRPPRT